jgi:tellurite methyltransferase
MAGSLRRESDRARWDRKYAAGEGPAHFRQNELLSRYAHLLKSGCALDVACGFGGNALYLASLGYRVDGIDASGVALARAKAEARQRRLRLNLVQANLDRWRFPAARYDLVTVFFYLNRDLMPALARALRFGGFLIQASRNTRFLAVRPEFNPNFLLEIGELPRLARRAGLEVVDSADEDASGGPVSWLVARRPD